MESSSSFSWLPLTFLELLVVAAGIELDASGSLRASSM